MAANRENIRASSCTKANSVRCSSYKIKKSEPIDYEFTIKVSTMTLSSTCDCSQTIKIKFCTQGNLKDVVLSADEVSTSDDGSKEIIINSKATIQTIMSFNNGDPLEKILKIVIEDHSKNSTKVLCYSKIDLSEVINNGLNSSSKSANIDVSLSQNLGLMRLCIVSNKHELREKVNMALVKPPVRSNCFKYDWTPMKTPKMSESISRSEINLKNINTIDCNNVNEISFCPEGEFNENDISEGESHYKSSNKKRASSQMNRKKPLGVCNRNLFVNRNTETVNNSEIKRGGTAVKNWIEDSVQKLTSTDSYSNIFENVIFSGSKTQDNKTLNLKTTDRYKGMKKGVPFDMTSQTNSEYQYFEPPREYYCNIEEGERLAKLSCAGSSEFGLSTENSVTCSMLSFSQEKDLTKTDNEKIDFINKLNEAKKNERKYKKEIKLLRMEKKALELKTTDANKYFQAESEKILLKAVEKITERINRPTKTKLYRPICRFFIEPILKVVNISDDKIQQFVDLVRNGGKDSGKGGLDEKPIKLTKRSINIDSDSITQRIKILEEENKNLNLKILENSKLQEIELDKVKCEKQKLEDLKIQLDEKIACDKKEKDDLNSKITNYKTRIFFLETQNEELENKKKSHIDMATNKLKIKNKNYEKELKLLKKGKEESDNKVEGLRNKLEEFIGNEQSVKNKEKQHKDKIDNLTTEISKLERKLIELKTEYADRMYTYEIDNQ